MVYSMDGIAGWEARHVDTHLATYLAKKWNRGCPEMVFYARMIIALAIVRANRLLIHGSRDRQKPCRPQISDRVSMYNWRVNREC